MIYYIENTIDERRTKIMGYFPTIEEAVDAMSECSDWFNERGTGEIYETDFGLGVKKKLVWKNGSFIN